MLLDTNIVSYFFRHDTRAARYERHLVGQPRYIALVTVAELYQWLFLRPFSEANRQRLIRIHRRTHSDPVRRQTRVDMG